LKRSHCGWALLSIFAVLLTGILALPIQAVAQPGGLRLPQSVEPDVRLEQLQQYQAPQSIPEVKVPETAPTRAPAGAETVRFVLRGLEVQGVTAYPKSVIEHVYEQRIGTETSLAEIYNIAEEIQRLYRKDGFFLARAIVPAQTSSEGRFRIQVFEGYVSDVVVEGDIGRAGNLVKDYLRNLPSERPLTLKTLERYLLLVNDIPGVVAKGTLRPATDQVGAAQLIASVERRVFDGMLTVDNLGSSFTGVWEASALLSLNSFTSLGDGWTLGGLLSDPSDGFAENNQRVIQAGGSVRPWSSGIYIKSLFSLGHSNPGGNIAELDVISDKMLVSAIVGYPIIRSRDLNLFVEAGLDVINTDTNIFDDITFSRDKLRVLHLTAFGDYHDAWRGSNFWSLGLRQGLPFLDASESGDEFLSRSDGSGVFTTLNMKVSRLQQIFGPFALLGKAAGQYAFSSVLIDEELGVGGTRFGRGYNPGELSGDHGVGATLEFQYTRPVEHRFLHRYQLFGFYDFGNVWDRGTGLSDSLSSAGGGVRAWFTPRFSVELALAKPLTHESLRGGDNKDLQVLFQGFALF